MERDLPKRRHNADVYSASSGKKEKKSSIRNLSRSIVTARSATDQKTEFSTASQPKAIKKGARPFQLFILEDVYSQDHRNVEKPAHNTTACLQIDVESE
jgi:hypothetical protein